MTILYIAIALWAACLGVMLGALCRVAAKPAPSPELDKEQIAWIRAAEKVAQRRAS